MAKDNYPQPPRDTAPSGPLGGLMGPTMPEPTPPIGDAVGVFPSPKDMLRLNDYDYYSKLFIGQHFEAFRIKIDNQQYNRAYARLRYLMVNFAGLISKIMADMLFSEPPVVKVADGDQDYIDNLWHDNQMDIQCYESALGNSYQGDAVFKLRVGKRHPKDTAPSVIIETVSPKIYFPKVDGFNVKAEPTEVELAWTFKLGDKEYLRKEIHYAGLIENKVYRMEQNKIMEEVGLEILGIADLPVSQETGIDRSLIVHVPNFKTGDRFFGLSDYHDLDSLFYAINNRMTKIDNILDKHGDPILMVPPGILDEKGQVKKKSLGVIEVAPGEEGKPEYVVWDASLDSAFKEIEKAIDFFYLTAEISPDILGLGEGVSDSGRALKFKLMRTLAKAQRKRLYYDYAIKELLYRAQMLAKAHNIKAGGKTLQGDPVVPEIDWHDGLPLDIHEQLEDETVAIDAGLTSKKDAMMRLYGIDEKAAEDELEEIEKEKPTITLPSMNMGNNGQGGASGTPGFGKTKPDDQLPPKGK